MLLKNCHFISKERNLHRFVYKDGPEVRGETTNHSEYDVKEFEPENIKKLPWEAQRAAILRIITGARNINMPGDRGAFWYTKYLDKDFVRKDQNYGKIQEMLIKPDLSEEKLSKEDLWKAAEGVYRDALNKIHDLAMINPNEFESMREESVTENIFFARGIIKELKSEFTTAAAYNEKAVSLVKNGFEKTGESADLLGEIIKDPSKILEKGLQILRNAKNVAEGIKLLRSAVTKIADPDWKRRAELTVDIMEAANDLKENGMNLGSIGKLTPLAQRLNTEMGDSEFANNVRKYAKKIIGEQIDASDKIPGFAKNGIKNKIDSLFPTND